MGKRADKLDETRQRIVEAAVELHSSLGPARTTVSQIAERAGVQRHTYYAHFPDEKELYLACSGLALERDPLPDLELLHMLPAGRARVQTGLERLYGWYERNEHLAACVLRDAEHHELTREMVELRLTPFFSNCAHRLGEGMGERSQSLLGVALEFRCWRSLSEKMTPATAAELMSDAIACV